MVSSIKYSYLMWGTVSHRLFKWHPQRKEKNKKYIERIEEYEEMKNEKSKWKGIL